MSWPIRVIEYTKETNGSTLQIGDAFYFNPLPGWTLDPDEIGWWWPSHFATGERLSKNFVGGRPPILVFLPGKVLFCVDGATFRTGPDGKTIYSGGWNVSGDLPNITLAPSINIGGIYHGFIRDGVISNDVEGRTFK
jgi:hypothetical protein